MPAADAAAGDGDDDGESHAGIGCLPISGPRVTRSQQMGEEDSEERRAGIHPFVVLLIFIFYVAAEDRDEDEEGRHEIVGKKGRFV